ncbi:MBL fold metallo-hydrolase [Aquibacillus albus]|uniref:Glyoxylase-like metal-dependent hydrolase (Beta-lactamase superfamily II) n=1 Tax=Aquibacillus albus TaxID=1168171 RepID=A0ABS2MZH4_9BACI|nr:glyoxylase-like metal-dependent hydrolase (beta-lactamase superfamily II) [Aquibacillus albus]
MDKNQENNQNEQLYMDHADPVEVLEDLAYYRTVLVNVCMIGHPDSDNWVLIDTAIEHYSKRIIAACEKRFGSKPPSAIILTHGHFDHVGSAKELAKYWDVPIYIHKEELAYVTGEKQYPPADPTMGGGMLSILSPFIPKKPENIKGFVQPLPENGELPYLNDWKYIHTPGHSPGHISLFRESDRTLITGDAILTEKPESTIALFLPIQKVYGPPGYMTHEWEKAEESVKKLADLEPETLLTAHGLPMEGETLRKQLHKLADNFIELAVPEHKRN